MTKEYIRVDGELYEKITPSTHINRHTFTDDAHLTDALTPASEEFDVAKCDDIEVLKEQFRHSFNKTKLYTEYCHEILLRIDELTHEH